MSSNNEKSKSASDTILQWVSFKLGGETYCVSVLQVQEVLRYSEVAPVPGAPSFVLGIINLRGKVITVVDTRSHFGLSPGKITDSTRVIIVEANNHVVGLLVDSVAEVIYLRESEIEGAPNVGSDGGNKFIQGVCHKNNELLIMVDLNKLLSADEWNALAKV